jgi:hypothetical protein
MLTLRKYSIGMTEEDKDLFLTLYLDTLEDSFFTGWDRFYHGQISIDKPWFGQVSRKQKHFKIFRAGTGILKSGLSMLEVTGKETEEDGMRRRLDVRISLSARMLITLVLFTLFVSLFAFQFLPAIWSSALLGLVVAIEVWAVIADLRKTDRRFRAYLAHVRNAVAYE